MKKGEKILEYETVDEIKNTEFFYIKGNKIELVKKYLEDKVESEIERMRTILSNRILIEDNDSQKNYNLPFCKVKKNFLNTSDENKEDEKILAVYDEWIENLIKIRFNNDKNNISISISFENDNKQKSWECFVNRIKINWLPEILFPNTDAIKNSTKKNLKLLNIFRHINIKEASNTGSDFFFFEETTFQNPFFSFLYSIDPEQTPFLAQYIIRQIAEAGLMRILIIDDRIATTISNKKNAEEELQKLSYMGIWIANEIKYNSQSIIKFIENPGNGFVEIDLGKMNKKEINCCYQNDGNQGKFNEISGFDILFLHQTVFDDKIAPEIKNEDDWKEKFIFGLKKQIPYIIFHSGRGHQKERLPKNVLFVEYSILQQYVLMEPSKFFLTLVAMSLLKSWR